jgi:hypothetical protein
MRWTNRLFYALENPVGQSLSVGRQNKSLLIEVIPQIAKFNINSWHGRIF